MFHKSVPKAINPILTLMFATSRPRFVHRTKPRRPVATSKSLRVTEHLTAGLSSGPKAIGVINQDGKRVMYRKLECDALLTDSRGRVSTEPCRGRRLRGLCAAIAAAAHGLPRRRVVLATLGSLAQDGAGVPWDRFVQICV